MLMLRRTGRGGLQGGCVSSFPHNSALIIDGVFASAVVVGLSSWGKQVGVYAAGWLRRGVVLVGCWKGCRGEELGLLAHRWEVGWRGGFSGAWGEARKWALPVSSVVEGDPLGFG